MVKKTKEEYWNKKITIPLGLEDLELRLFFRIKKGKTENFCLIFRKKFGSESRKGWKTIIKCDNTKQHGCVPHCHYYKEKGKTRMYILGNSDTEVGSIVAEIVKQIKKDYQKIIENFKYSK